MRLKLIFVFFLITVNFNTNSQSIEIRIIDSKTKNPIPYVNVYSPKSMEGSISNDEGKCIINNFSDTLIISHLIYDKKKKKFSLNDNYNTISLEKEITVLNEITVYSFDLKEKIKQVSKNIKQFYETKPINYNGTYKEKFIANDSIKRLFQVQFEWYKKNGVIHDYKNKFDNQNQIKIKSIDYSKILNTTILENSGILPNSYLFQILSINYYIEYFLNYAENISINSVKKTNNIVEVIFNGDIIEKGKLIASFRNSVIYFNSKMDYIKKIKLDLVYNKQTHEGVSRTSKTPYKSSINNHRLYIQFRKIDSKRKYSLNIFKTEVIGVASYNNSKFAFRISQDFLITTTKRKGKPFPTIDKIDINNPFYDGIKEKLFKTQSTKYPLTQKESTFINE